MKWSIILFAFFCKQNDIMLYRDQRSSNCSCSKDQLLQTSHKEKSKKKCSAWYWSQKWVCSIAIYIIAELFRPGATGFRRQIELRETRNAISMWMDIIWWFPDKTRIKRCWWQICPTHNVPHSNRSPWSISILHITLPPPPLIIMPAIFVANLHAYHT